jgi:sugar/nucleoside kinase (ribokinase family)
MSLIVTGTIGIDTIVTPTGRATGALGGSCAYFAAAASFFAPVRVVAAVGHDWPAEHREKLSRFRNIDLSGLEVRSDATTFAWGGRYKDDMIERETLFTELGVLEQPPPPVPPHFCDSEFIFLANTHPTVQLDLLAQFPRRKLAAADSMNLWINIARDPLLELLRKLDGFVLNDEESFLLTNIRNPVSAARHILDLGPRFVIVKKGAHGAVLVHREGVATIPAFPAEMHAVIDPTGAGDAFAGGMMGYLAAMERTDFDSIQTALAWGTVTASFTIESFGLDRMLEINRGDIDARMKLFQRVARVG